MSDTHPLVETILHDVFACPGDRRFLSSPHLIDIETVDGELLVQTHNAPQLFAAIFDHFGFEPMEEIEAGHSLSRFVFTRQGEENYTETATITWDAGESAGEVGVFNPLEDISFGRLKEIPSAYVTGTPIGTQSVE